MSGQPWDTKCSAHGRSLSLIQWSNSSYALWSLVRFHCGCEVRNSVAPENAAWMRENYPDFTSRPDDAS